MRILTFNTFDKENILLNDSVDPDSNFFNTHVLLILLKIKIKVNSKTRLSPWIKRGILKSSKQKQKLHENFFEEYKFCK